MTPRILLAFALTMAAPGEDSPLSLADLDAYRLALRPGSASRASAVTFRDLWERPSDFAGRRVRVEGRLARLFRQPAVGEFPALVEAWVVSAANDPFCLIYPESGGPGAIEVGSTLRFEGTFLRKIRYRGGDVPRLAPLIVGPGPPSAESGPISVAWPGSAADWALGLGAACVVAAILGARHLGRPPARLVAADPPPSFVDGEAAHPNGVTDEFA